MDKKRIKIFATDLRAKERFEITDLYWFEENFVNDFGGDGFDGCYKLEVFVDDKLVFVNDARFRIG